MELRIFPLRTVLFPGMSTPLRVFEDRYRLLVSECVRASEPFGVALIREGEEVGGPAAPFDVGTTARIESVKPDREGRLRVHVVGERRFRILELHHDRAYLWADVEYPVDEATEVPEPMVERARERYSALVRLRLTVGGEYVRTVHTPDSPALVADAAAAILASPPEELQRLLETTDVRRRLERTIELLEAAIPVAHREASTAVARRYGGIASLN